jgi:nucleotide-binding universal stress UspA family protein
VILLHVIVDRRGEFVFPTRAEAEEYLDSPAKELADKGIRVRTGIRFESGAAPGAILAAADALDADLIAMATRAPTGLNRLLFGSVAAAVLRDAQVPVLMMRTAEKPATSPR